MTLIAGVGDFGLTELKDEAIAAKNAAQTAETGAVAAKNSAETASSAAVTAKIAAQTAETGAVAAMDFVEVASTTAVNASDAAEAAQASAVSAKIAAQTAETGAVAAKNSAETASSAAVTAKIAAQTAETGAVTAKTDAQNLVAGALIGTPKAVYASLSALNTANPDHAFIYVTTDNGHWNYWNGSAFASGGTYQAPLIVVQETGTSTSNVMSQNAVTNELIGKASVNSSLQITNAKIDTLSYKHPRGDSEYDGNGIYVASGLGSYLEPQAKKILIKKVKIRYYASSDFVGTAGVYKGTTLSNDPASHTLVQLFSFTAGQFNTDANGYHELILTNDLILAANEYLYIFTSTTNGTMTIKRWTSDSGLAPYRNNLFFKIGSVWYSGDSSYMGLPFLLYSDTTDISTLGGKVATLESSSILKDANTLLAENTKIKPISYKHPRGDSEYVGDSQYGGGIDGLGLYLEPQGKKLLVKIIKTKFYGTDFDGTVSVYKGTTLSQDPSSHTLVQTFTYTAGQFNSDSGSFIEIQLTSDLVLAANEYLYVFAQRTAGSVYMRRWLSDSGSAPLRKTLFLKAGGVWYTTDPGYYFTPLLVYSDIPIEDLKSKVESFTTSINNLNSAVNTAPMISLPDNIIAIVGDKLQLFFRGMIAAKNPYNYDILVTCSKGALYPRYFEYSPVVGDIGTTTLKVEVKSDSGAILSTKTVNLITKQAVGSPSTNKKVLCVGDSLTAAGIWPLEASRRLKGTGGTPAGLGLSNISFLGRLSNGSVGFEGNGGWTWNDYATAGWTAYRFTVSGITTAPNIGSEYTNNGQTFSVAEVNVTSGSGNIRFIATGAPTASGTLTKSSGTGDATISFSASSLDAGNPFWNASTGSLDFGSYVTAYMGGACDVVYFLLTWNGVGAGQTDFSSMIASAKTLIDHIHTVFPSLKVKVMGIQVPSLNGGMGANAGATTAYADTYGMVRTALNMNKAYQDFANEAGYSSFVEFVNVSAQFDSENNMPESDTYVNSRSTKTEKRGTNGVHPSTDGYYQIADVVFRNFVSNYCQ